MFSFYSLFLYFSLFLFGQANKSNRIWILSETAFHLYEPYFISFQREFWNWERKTRNPNWISFSMRLKGFMGSENVRESRCCEISFGLLMSIWSKIQIFSCCSVWCYVFFCFQIPRSQSHLVDIENTNYWFFLRRDSSCGISGWCFRTWTPKLPRCFALYWQYGHSYDGALPPHSTFSCRRNVDFQR